MPLRGRRQPARLAAIGGIELGGASVKQGTDRQSGVLPTGLAWAGVPELHAFASLLSDRFAMDMPSAAIGIGHSSRWVGAQLAASTQGFAFDGEARVLPWLAPTVSLRYIDGRNWNVAGGLTLHFDAQSLERAFAEGPPAK